MPNVEKSPSCPSPCPTGRMVRQSDTCFVQSRVAGKSVRQRRPVARHYRRMAKRDDGCRLHSSKRVPTSQECTAPGHLQPCTSRTERKRTVDHSTQRERTPAPQTTPTPPPRPVFPPNTSHLYPMPVKKERLRRQCAQARRES